MATNRKWGDKIGISASVLCLIHCVVLPLLVTTVSFRGLELTENVLLEVALLTVSVLIGGWALWKGFQAHQNRRLLLQFCCGLLFVVLSNWVAGGRVEAGLKLGGALLLIVTHLQNLKYCKACKVPVHCENAGKGTESVNLV